MAQLPIDLAETPAGTDVQGMRHWVQELFLSRGLMLIGHKRKLRPVSPVRTLHCQLEQ